MAEMMKKVVMEGPKKSKIIEVPAPQINDDLSMAINNC